MDRKKLTADLVEFLKSKVPADNEISIHGEYQIRIEGQKKGLDNQELFSWVEEFFKSKSLSAKRNVLGFMLKESIFTITTHSSPKPGYPFFMSIISSTHFDGKDLFK
jgi:hypothetical protein